MLFPSYSGYVNFPVAEFNAKIVGFCRVVSLLLCLLQVIDTPYLVNPEWKNFIPGYLYNDSDLELTAESFYRQIKLISYVFRVTVFCESTLETRRSAG